MCLEIQTLYPDYLLSNFMSSKKRNKQYNKQELLEYIDLYQNDKKLMSENMGISEWSLRSQLISYGIMKDNRKKPNNSKIPSREELEYHYHEQSLTLLEISKIYSVSNVTVKNWMIRHNIDLLTHSQTIRKKVIPKIISHNQKNHGYDHFFASDDGKKKVADSFMRKYGVPYHPINNVSNAELEVLDYFNSLNSGFTNTKIFGIELDGYNPSINVAFEYCGLYWHSESRKGKNLHIKKYNICRDNNIRLFTIFEDEWKHRRVQVKSFIRAALHKNTNRLFARKLTLEEIAANNNTVIEFIENHHIQGFPNNRNVICHFVLKYENDIVCAITISKHHRNNKEIIISRYCVKSDYDIIGGSFRLFNAIKKKFNCQIKTWSDNRWTEGMLYERLGFELYDTLPIDYYYIHKNTRINKQNMTRKKIGASENQTEYQKALELGFDRIWDCGKKTWLYKP